MSRTDCLDVYRFTPRHLKMLRILRSRILEPQEFIDKWGVSRQQLAELLDLSSLQVNRWFLSPDATTKQEVQEKHKRRLAEIDYILEAIEKAPPHLRRIIEEKSSKPE